MAAIKVYLYDRCSTCRNAVKWLNDHAVPFKGLPIRETPPSLSELKLALRTEGNIRKILNTSSQDYRDLGLKDRLDSLTTDEVFALLKENGNLVKRPFVVGPDAAWAGFKPEVWQQRLS